MLKDSERAKAKGGENVGYARVSTADQNLDMQLERLHKFPCDRIFQDKISASKKREGWTDCWRYLREGDTLVVYSLSRLARSVEELLKINKGLIERGIMLVSLTEPIDTRTPVGKLMFNIYATMAQFERDITVQRTKDGIARRRERGELIGRPAAVTDKIKKAIRRDLLAHKLTVKAICAKYKISKQLLNYHFPGGRQNIKGKR